MPYNYNNTHEGQLVVYPPPGWSLHLTFVNKQGITHNAILLKTNVSTPGNLAQDGIILAQIPHDAMKGGFLVNGESGSVTVNDLSPGTYWIACALNYPTPHAEEGMWIWLIITQDTTLPYYVITS